MKLVLKIFGGIIAVVVAAVLVVYFGWLSPPDAESVCNNMARIVKDEKGIELPDQARDDCLRRASKAPEFGRAVWVAELKCLRDARTSDDLNRCDQR